MKHRGKAFLAALRILVWTALAGVAALVFTAWLIPEEYRPTVRVVVAVVVVAAMVFTLCFFRDPDPRVPAEPGVVVAPAHGKVDFIEETEHQPLVGGRCQRVSIFLSIFDVHVQYAPVAGTVGQVTHTPGKFLNALKAESAIHNENVLVGFHASASGGVKVGVRLIAGLIARRIIPWLEPGETVESGERISLIQFGSRVDVYLPLQCQINVRLGQHVRGGETILARLPT